MTRTLTTKLLLLCCMVLGCLQMQAQGWEKKYSPDVVMAINTVVPTADGNYLVTGWNIGGNYSAQRVMKIAGNGDVVWKSDIDSFHNPGAANVTQEGGIVILGNNQSGHRNLAKIDGNGNMVWMQRVLPYNVNGGGTGNMDIDTTDNKGFIAVFPAYDSALLANTLYVNRFDSNGNSIWGKTYYTPSDTPAVCYAICNSKDGGFIVTTAKSGQLGLYLFKVDSAGNKVWEYNPPHAQNWISASIGHDGNILLLSTDFGGGDNAISKINQQGQLLWRQAYAFADTAGWGWYGHVEEKNNGELSVMVTGYDTINIPGYLATTRAEAFALTRVDTLGHLIRYRQISTVNLGSNAGLYEITGKAIATSHEGGVIFGGWLQYDPQNYSAYLIKADSNGQVYPTTLSGYVYGDNNNNCNKDTDEIFLKPVNVTLTSPLLIRSL